MGSLNRTLDVFPLVAGLQCLCKLYWFRKLKRLKKQNLFQKTSRESKVGRYLVLSPGFRLANEAETIEKPVETFVSQVEHVQAKTRLVSPRINKMERSR